MATRRKLISYLPYIYRDYLEFQGICAGSQPEIDEAWDTAEYLLDNQFVPTAEELGLARWESMLGITASGDYAARRARILELLQGRFAQYTITWLREWLEEKFGEGKTAVTVEDYTLWIEYLDLGDDAVDLTDEIADDLEQIIPVNLRYGRIVSTSMEGTTAANTTPVCTWLSTCLPEWDKDEAVLGNFFLDVSTLGGDDEDEEEEDETDEDGTE